MLDLPETVVFEILSRLPVKPLMRFRCVCKQWRELFSDMYFISMHLNNYTLSKHNSDFLKYLLVRRNDYWGDRTLFRASLISKDYNLINLSLYPVVTDVCYVFGPYHGIFCLYNLFGFTVLWNPSLRQMMNVQMQQPSVFFPHNYHAGFGYDSITKNYKLLHIFNIFNGTTYETTGFNVFNLGNKSWGTVDVVENPKIRLQEIGCNVGSKYICWLAEDGQFQMQILSFDVCDELIKTMPLPRAIRYLRPWPFDKYTRNIFPFYESVAVVNYTRWSAQSFDMWVMKEFGVEESWMKLFSFHDPALGTVKPLGFLKNDEKLLIKKWSIGIGLLLYDHHTQEIESPGLNLPCDSEQVLFYEESLVTFT